MKAGTVPAHLTGAFTATPKVVSQFSADEVVEVSRRHRLRSWRCRNGGGAGGRRPVAGHSLARQSTEAPSAKSWDHVMAAMPAFIPTFVGTSSSNHQDCDILVVGA